MGHRRMYLGAKLIDRLSFGFHNPNHAAALACALLPLCWGWRRYPWLGRILSLALFLAVLMTRSRTGLAVMVAEAADVMPEDRIWLPSEEVADAWGVPGWRGGDGGVRVTSESVCAVWGEDDTRCVMPREAIDPEFLNPLFNARIADLWRQDAP